MIDRTRCVRPQGFVGHSQQSRANLVGGRVTFTDRVGQRSERLKGSFVGPYGS